MVRIAALCLLALAYGQAFAEIIPADFIENVIARQNAALPETSPRIVSGWEAYLGQHPHQVSLRLVAFGGLVGGCGGSVVHPLWLITAAHCTAGRVTIVVRAGLVDLRNPEYMSETTHYWNYPTYDDTNVWIVQPNDISIVKLIEPVVYTANLQPIRIQPSGDAFRNYEGDVVVASGFGRTWTGGATTDTLNWVYLRMVSNARCALNFGTNLITNNAICAQFYNVTSQSTCEGDSGGPLVHYGQNDGSGAPTLVGVASFVAGGDFGCHSGFPAGFIRPGPFHNWFHYITGIDFENLDETTTTEAPTETTEVTDTTTETITETTEVTDTTTETITETTEVTDTTTETITEPTEVTDTTTEPTTDITEAPESEEDDSESDEDAEEDPELKDLLKRLEVLVKVKVRMNKFKHRHESHVVKHHNRH